MKMDMKNQENLKDAVLDDTNKVTNAPEMDENSPVEKPQRALDDARRVKVLSPGLLVFKRFIRNKLAIVGIAILAFMFAFSFLGAMISPYSEREMFYSVDNIIYDYAEATISDYNLYQSSVTVHNMVRFSLVDYLTKVPEGGEYEFVTTDRDRLKYSHSETYKIVEKGEGRNVFMLQKSTMQQVATFNNGVVTVAESEYDNAGFITAVMTAVNDKTPDFNYGGKAIHLSSVAKSGEVYAIGDFVDAIAVSNFVLNAVVPGATASTGLWFAFCATRGESDTFIYDEKTYKVVEEEDEIVNMYVAENNGDLTHVFIFADLVVRSRTGADTLSVEFKEKVKIAVDFLYANTDVSETEFYMTTTVMEPVYVYDEDGNIIEEETTYEEKVLENARFTVAFSVSSGNSFTVKTAQDMLLISRYKSPSGEHWLGTDSSGMDVLTRMMYGGRISLMIGFVVIIIETMLGVVLGGIAGYFGKWIDNLIMRVVDIFNCIPFLPVLLILGSFFDEIQLAPMNRIIWLMVVMGVLGWPGIARLVRGQILSLREQEFMIAAEATGLSVKRRIFKHLVPNVMPQLIVQATMGLGSIIITESTLSFLGLGAKYPMATWGAMINGVSSAYALQSYPFIWLPIGIFICLTVVAFNFVGDGLRDAFDPKMKR